MWSPGWTRSRYCEHGTARGPGRAKCCAIQGSIGTDLHNRDDASLAAHYRCCFNFAPTNPSSVMLWPASRSGPGRTGSGSRRLRSRRRPAQQLSLRLRSPASGPEPRGQARPGQSDSDDSDAPGCSPCFSGFSRPVPWGRLNSDLVTRMRLRERGGTV